MGRPEVEFSQKDRAEIEHLAGLCLSHKEIALIKKCNEDTLKKHCPEELERGKAKALLVATNALFRLIKKGEPSAIFFYLKTRHNWREKSQVEVTGLENGPPIATIQYAPRKPDPSSS